MLAPSPVDPASGYRYYDTGQLAEAATVGLLRRAGIPLADIAEFLARPSGEQLDGWERSLRAEVHVRRDALAEVRARLGLGTARTRGVTMVEITPVEDREELGRVFDLLGAQGTDHLDTSDFRFADLDTHFVDDQPLMVVATTESQLVGGALAFRNDHGVVVLRIIAVVEAFRHRGIGRRLVERVESEARILGVEKIGLGTDAAVGFWFHLGYTPNLLFQWVYDPAAHDEERELLLAGPLSGLRHWRSSFNDVPQLFVELDEPRLGRGRTGSAPEAEEPAHLRGRAHEGLGPPRGPRYIGGMAPPDRVLLIGMMGVGKSTVGRALAGRLGCPHLDSDEQVERATGRTVVQILETDGEAAFRAEEKRALAEAVATEGPVVVSVAGGAVLDPDNRRLIAASGLVVWLRAELPTMARRVGLGRGRPLLGVDPPASLARLYPERQPLYEELAALVVDVDHRTPAQVVDEVLACLV